MENGRFKKWCCSDGGVLAIILGAILLFVVAYNVLHCELIRQWAKDNKNEVQFTGQLGDSMNIFTCIFTFCALIGVVLNLRHEKEESSKRDEEYKNSEKQRHLEQFHQTFFQLTQIFRETVSKWECEDLKRNIHRGKDCIELFTSELRQIASNKRDVSKDIRAQDIASWYGDLVHNAPYRREKYLKPYKNFLLLVLQHITSSRLDPHDRERYMDLFFAEQLGSEVELLAVMGLYNTDLRRLIEYYGLLAYLPLVIIPDSPPPGYLRMIESDFYTLNLMQKFYERTAFEQGGRCAEIELEKMKKN